MLAERRRLTRHANAIRTTILRIPKPRDAARAAIRLLGRSPDKSFATRIEYRPGELLSTTE
jgi:hypothetical protein